MSGEIFLTRVKPDETCWASYLRRHLRKREWRMRQGDDPEDPPAMIIVGIRRAAKVFASIRHSRPRWRISIKACWDLSKKARRSLAALGGTRAEIPACFYRIQVREKLSKKIQANWTRVTRIKIKIRPAGIQYYQGWRDNSHRPC